MKKIFSTLLIGLSLFSIAGCSDSDYADKYTDPSKTTTVGVPQVFTGVMFKANTWMNPVYYRYYTQSSTSGIFSGIIGDYNTRGRFRGASEGYFNNRWKNFYDMVTQFRVLEETYNNLSDKEKDVNTVFVHLSRTLVYSQLHEILSLFGDAPFNGAGTLWKSDYSTAQSKCVYDDDVVLYKQILSDLKETGDFLSGSINSTGVASLGLQDYSTAAGSTTIWRKYVNSLRLRIALHLATNGDCTSEAQAAIKEILENPTQYPLIDSNAENMGVKGDTQTDNFNFGKSMSQALRTGNFAAGSNAVLKAMNVPTGGIPNADTDPRLAAMYDCNPDGEYIAPDISMSNSEITNLASEKNQEYVQRGITQANYFCEVDTQAVAGYASYEGNANLDGLWLGAAEVSLSKAEAYLMGYGVAKDEAKAKECFIQGVKQSCEYYWDMKKGSSLYKKGNDSYNGFRALVEPTDAEIDAYAEKIWQPTQEAVCTQLWLNFGYMNELEAWNVVRRTGFPVITFARDQQISNYPTPPNRLPYPSDELSFNKTNCQNAIQLNYEESTGYYTNLFWAKKDYYQLISGN